MQHCIARNRKRSELRGCAGDAAEDSLPLPPSVPRSVAGSRALFRPKEGEKRVLSCKEGGFEYFKTSHAWLCRRACERRECPPLASPVLLPFLPALFRLKLNQPKNALGFENRQGLIRGTQTASSAFWGGRGNHVQHVAEHDGRGCRHRERQHVGAAHFSQEPRCVTPLTPSSQFSDIALKTFLGKILHPGGGGRCGWLLRCLSRVCESLRC